MDGLLGQATRWVTLGTDPQSCPECGGDLEPGYVRDPSSQGHWRGVEALCCAECDYAERDERPSE